MNDLIFFDDGRTADPRLYIEWPKGTKADIYNDAGEYLFSMNRHPQRLAYYTNARNLPLCVVLKKCEPDTRKPEDYKANRPAMHLTVDQIEDKLWTCYRARLKKVAAETPPTP